MEKKTSAISDSIELLGSCGANCHQCVCRIATITQDLQKKQDVAQKWSKLYNTPLTVDMISCTGCQVPGDKFMYPQSECTVRPCVLSKGFHTCAECSEYACEKIRDLHAGNPKAKAKITDLRSER